VVALLPLFAFVHARVLRRKLQEAVAGERFEEAARLRDEIRRLADEP